MKGRDTKMGNFSQVETTLLVLAIIITLGAIVIGIP